MKDEIKEINIKFPGQILDYVDTKEHLLELFNYITNLQKEKDKYKNVFDKALYWLSENTHYTSLKVDKLVLDENANLKELLELLEEVE